MCLSGSSIILLLTVTGKGGRKLVQITLKTLCGALSYSSSAPVLDNINKLLL